MATKQDREIAHGLRDLVTTLHRRLRKQISNPQQLSLAELNVMSILMGSPEMAPSEMGKQLHISSQFMAQVLNHLESLDYISRKPDPQDGRRVLVSITEKGSDIIAGSRNEREEWLASIIAGTYTAKEKKLLSDALALLAALPEP